MKQIRNRIQHKYDTQTNWDKALNFIPLLGELIIYLPDATHSDFRCKIGDGETTVINLPFTLSNNLTDELKQVIEEASALYLKNGSAEDSLQTNSSSATGYGSLAIGQNNKALGYGSVALGSLTQAQGERSLALGYRNLAKGNYSVVLGQDSSSIGYHSFAHGIGCLAQGAQTTTIGNNLVSGTPQSLTIGKYNLIDTARIKPTDWTPSYSYFKGAIASYQDKIYKSLQDNNQNQNPLTSSEAWEETTIGAFYKGHWSSTTQYQFSDIVKADDGSYYSARKTNIGVNPINDETREYWTIIWEGNYAFAIGQGTDDNNRANVCTINKNGTGWFANDIYVGGTYEQDGLAKKVATEEYVNNHYPSSFIGDMPPEGVQIGSLWVDTSSTIAYSRAEDNRFPTTEV